MKRLKHRLKSLRKNNLIGFKTVPLLSGAVLFLGVENKDNFRHNDFVLILDICPGGEIGRRTTLRW